MLLSFEIVARKNVNFAANLPSRFDCRDKLRSTGNLKFFIWRYAVKMSNVLHEAVRNGSYDGVLYLLYEAFRADFSLV